jgi:HEAT repeat protein
MPTPPPIVRIFVSSTLLDLQPERKAVETALQRMRETKFIGMEYFGGREETTRQTSLYEVDRSQVYVGIFGGRYGSGITEAEYRRARERELPCFIYYKDEASLSPEEHETEEEKTAKLIVLKQELKSPDNHTISEFSNPDDLATKVTADLNRWLFEEYLEPRLEKATRGEYPHEEATALLTAIRDLNTLNQNLLEHLRKAGYIEAKGDRSIAVGGNVNNSVLATGNHATIYLTKDHRCILSPEERQRKLAAYRRRVVEANGFVNLRGIPLPHDRSGRPVQLQIPLDQVYIHLQAIDEQHSRRQKETEHRDIEEEIRTKDSQRSRPISILETLRPLGEYLYRRGQVYQTTERPEPVDPREALQKHDRLVILGAPGAGKSTLLRYLARMTANDQNGPLPILVRLRDYAAAVSQNQTLQLRDFALHETAGGDERLEQALREEVESGHVLWFTDALDETHGWQEKASQQASQLPGRLIVTSRLVGYQQVGFELLPHFEVLPLTPRDVERFLHDWFSVLAEQRGTDSHWVNQRIAWLLKQLQQRPRLRSLVSNPLLLTFMVILAGEDPLHELPSQRAELYRQYVEELLDSWEAYRHPPSSPAGKPAFTLGLLEGDTARRVALEGFYYLGWYLQLAYYGGHEERTRLDQRALEALLVRYYEGSSEWSLPKRELQSLAKETLEFWIEAGILDVWRIESEEYLAFRHLTFQEYAAARKLADAWKKNPQSTWKPTLYPILHHYAWREPILLLAGLLDTAQLNDLVRRLLRGTSKYERYLHRDLLLAATLMGEGAVVDSRLTKTTISNLRWLILCRESVLWKQKVTLWAAYLLGVITIWSTLSSWWLCSAGLLWTVVWVFAFLKPVLPRVQVLLGLPARMWRGVIEPEPFIQALGQIQDPQAINLLTQALGDPDWRIREAVVQTLGHTQDPRAIDLLIQTLDDSSEWVRRAAAEALGRTQDLRAVDPLIRTLHDSNGIVCEAVARSLGQIQNSRVLDLLIQVLKTPAWHVRKAAAEALGQIQDRRVVSPLLHALRDSAEGVRKAVAKALGNTHDPRVVEPLIETLHDSGQGVRKAAAESLGQLQEPQVINLLVQALDNPEWWVREAAAEALGQRHDPVIVPALLRALADSHAFVRSIAAKALGHTRDPQAVDPLIKALHDSSWPVQEAAAKSLGQLQDPRAVSPLIQILHHSTERVRKAAAESLGWLQDSRTVAPLIEALHNSVETVREAAASALGQKRDPQVIKPLIEALNDPAEEVRRAAAKSLGQLQDSRAVSALIHALHNPAWRERMAAARVLRQMAQSISDLKQIERITRALWKRITDLHRVSAAARQALEQAANRLPVIEITSHPVQDLFARSESSLHPRWKQAAWGLSLLLVLGLLDLFRGVFTNLLSELVDINGLPAGTVGLLLVVGSLILFIIMSSLQKAETSQSQQKREGAR